MVARLRSTIKRTPWSLLLKAAISALSFWFIHSWLFAVISVALYVVPLFRPAELWYPLALFLAAAYFAPNTPFFVLLLWCIMVLILGIKDLVIVHRTEAREALLFLLVLLGSLIFFMNYGTFTGSAPGVALLLSALFLFLLKWFLRAAVPGPSARERTLWSSLGALLVLELLWILLLSPFNFMGQTALLFLVVFLMVEILYTFLAKNLERRTLLLHFSFFFVFAVVILASNRWGL